MTKAQSIAYKLRWLILIAGLGCLATWLWFVLIPFWHNDPSFVIFPVPLLVFMPHDWPFQHEMSNYAIDVALFLGLFLVTQWLFLRPRRGWQPQLVAVSRPMKSAMVAAAFVAMLLSVGLVATLLELPNLWSRIYDGPSLGYYYAVCGTMALMWAVWFLIFFIYWKQGDRYTQLGHMIRALIAGSFLEGFVATGVYAWNPHNEDCYCARGSYTGLVFGGTALLWCFGPGIILLFMREKYRRERLLPTCMECGYDLRGTIAAGRTECPECGAAIAKVAHQKSREQ